METGHWIKGRVSCGWVLFEPRGEGWTGGRQTGRPIRLMSGTRWGVAGSCGAVAGMWRKQPPSEFCSGKSGSGLGVPLRTVLLAGLGERQVPGVQATPLTHHTLLNPSTHLSPSCLALLGLVFGASPSRGERGWFGPSAELQLGPCQEL